MFRSLVHASRELFSDLHNQKSYFKFTNNYPNAFNLIPHLVAIIQNRILGSGFGGGGKYNHK